MIFKAEKKEPPRPPTTYIINLELDESEAKILMKLLGSYDWDFNGESEVAIPIRNELYRLGVNRK